jgi:hypothetical protein
MGIDTDKRRLSQVQTLQHMQRDMKWNEMITVYQEYTEEYSKHYIYCALIPSAHIEKALSVSTWDMEFSQSMPSGMISNKGRREIREYLRYGVDNGVEPLIINRSFHRLRDDYREISEEFRLFHALYHDRKTDQYIKIDEDGNEEIVAVVEPNHIQIRLKEIRQFLAIKEMHLAIQFIFTETSTQTLEALEFTPGDKDKRDNLMRWMQRYGDLEGINNCRAFSRLVGKRIVKPFPKTKSGFWPFAEVPEQEYVSFIIDVNENGEEIIHTSNPDELKTPADPGNIRGVDEDAPSYLTPVHFRKKVLDKYYHESSKYTVEDSILRCGSLWSVYIDNHHDDIVCAWLGDLGRDLPYSEQEHWRQFNIPPTSEASKAYFTRQIETQFANSDRLEHIFKQRYDDLQKVSQTHLGWQWLLPLHTADAHHLQSLRIPTTDEQRDFDGMVLSLTKMLIDSLNEKSLRKLIPFEKQEAFKDKSGIALLEAALHLNNFEGYDVHTDFLRKLQKLRSSGSAHRKGRNYLRIAEYFGVENQSLRHVFANILNSASDTLDYFIVLVNSGRIREIIERNNREAADAIFKEMIGMAESDKTDASVNHDDAIYELETKP